VLPVLERDTGDERHRAGQRHVWRCPRVALLSSGLTGSVPHRSSGSAGAGAGNAEWGAHTESVTSPEWRLRPGLPRPAAD
jgi:hypothetical protein